MPLVDFRQGQAEQLPLRENEWGTFDVAHTRFLLEHVPDPAAVVRQMIRAVRPGGRIILQDDAHDTHRLWPEPPGFGRLWSAYLRTYDRLGNDPFVGVRLVSLLVEAGAVPHATLGCSSVPVPDSPNSLPPTSITSCGSCKAFASPFSASASSTPPRSIERSTPFAIGAAAPTPPTGMPSPGPKAFGPQSRSPRPSTT